MKLIFCLDDHGGMMFNQRRQSQDRVLRAWILEHCAGTRLWMSPYSAKLFGELGGISADADYLEKAAPEEYCFIEDGPYSVADASEIILCRWHRKYPYDRCFDADLPAEGFRKIAQHRLVGSSHDKITVEIYRKDLP